MTGDRRMIRRAIAAGLLSMLVAGGAAPAAPPVPLAVFDVQFMNTSLMPDTPEEAARLRAMGQQLRDTLTRSGRYTVLDLAPIRVEIDRQPELRSCNGCVLPLARKLGARQAAVAWVHKVSNLILNINLEIDDATSGARIFAGSVDIRGDTDESWDRGMRYLLENQVLVEQPGKTP